MSLKNAAAEYFSNLNPIAARLCTDLQETKSAYEDFWNKLSQEEQDQILTESIIKPEISIKYNNNPAPKKRSEEYAVKIVVDDNNYCSYRDEHSGPFSYQTKSQRNLTIFQEEIMVKSKSNEEEGVKIKLIKPIPKLPSIIPIYDQQLYLENKTMNVSKNEDGLSSNSSTLPKTGLDFLDNW